MQSAPTTEWKGGRVRPRRRLLPPAARHGHRHRPRRLGRGLVRGRRRGERVVHLPGRLRDRQPRSGRRGRGLHRRLAGPGAGPALPRRLPRRPGGQRRRADVYDVDAAGRRPDALGVLSHYDAVIWTRATTSSPAPPAGPRQRRPAGARRAARVPRLHERGRQGAARRRLAGQQYTGAAVGNQLYDPKGEIACNPLPAGTTRGAACRCGVFFGATGSTMCCSTTSAAIAVASDGHAAARRSTSASTTRSRR